MALHLCIMLEGIGAVEGLVDEGKEDVDFRANSNEKASQCTWS